MPSRGSETQVGDSGSQVRVSRSHCGAKLGTLEGRSALPGAKLGALRAKSEALGFNPEAFKAMPRP